jgi:spore photoproduct lyase
MKDKMIERYPSTTLPFGELIRGMDGKMRYARPVRVPMYKFIYQKITGVSDPPFIYFCMESRDVWEEVTGASPESNAHLDYLFAESLYKRFAGLMAEKPVRDKYERGFSLERIPNKLG